MKPCLPWALGLLLLGIPAPLAAQQEALPPLPVRKDALRPGWFFVGVLPGTPKTAPILVEIRAAGDTGPPRQYRSPDARAFDLCAMLRAAGLATQPGALQLNVSRGPGSFAFSISYDGKRCASAPEAPSAARTERPAPIEPLRLGVAPPPAPPAEPTEAPALVAQTRPSPVAGPAEEPPQKPAPETVRVEAETQAPPAAAETAPAPEPVQTPAPVVAAATPPPASPTSPPDVAAAPELSLGPSPQSAGPSLSAAERGLTTANLEWMKVFIEENRKLKTEDYKVELRFKKPVNIEGIETAAILKAISVMGRPKEFLDVGSEHILDPPEDPRSTSWISFSVPSSLTIEAPGVNHWVVIRLRIGELAEAVFETKSGIVRRKGP
ncbi:hypothetical protein FBQ97_16775 [Acidobacteria bacterium ACD]|nr:MAG: hypothetical protein EDX89_08360 [Acidobacteriota bacterium]MDL1951449.1 hypothetical protein [Acidobacteria bacterium ACD]